MKALKELTLLDKFLFDQTMDIPEAQEAALQIILSNEELKLLTPPQTEKEFRTAPWLKSIRMDVFSLDEDRTVYNTEMQAERRTDLVRRSRYYQGLIDSSLLEPGAVSYNLLNNVYIIIITPFDLFGENRYCYTFQSYCRENKELRLQDGAVRIFLNTKGTNDSEVSRELVDFLHYIECVDGEFAKRSGSDRIQKIHGCVTRVKASEEIGVKYMQSWEEKILEREKGREEGRREMLIDQVCRKLKKGKAPEQIAEELEEELPVILEICEAAGNFAPEYDNAGIKELLIGKEDASR